MFTFDFEKTKKNHEADFYCRVLINLLADFYC